MVESNYHDTETEIIRDRVQKNPAAPVPESVPLIDWDRGQHVHLVRMSEECILFNNIFLYSFDFLHHKTHFSTSHRIQFIRI